MIKQTYTVPTIYLQVVLSSSFTRKEGQERRGEEKKRHLGTGMDGCVGQTWVPDLGGVIYTLCFRINPQLCSWNDYKELAIETAIHPHPQP
ncbi:hypothetical protein WAI453_009156 [Rhynchosporium graminicola]